MLAKNVRELGAILREARQTKGMTQRDLARRINVTQSVISKVEKGYPGASVGLIFQMLRALGLPMKIGDAVPSPKWALEPGHLTDLIDLDAIANTGLNFTAAHHTWPKRK